MKKTVFLIAVLCGLILTACQVKPPVEKYSSPAEKYSSYVCDYANDGIITHAEQEQWVLGYQAREEALPEKEIMFRGAVYRGVYDISSLPSGMYSMRDRYNNREERIEFQVDSSTGAFAGIFFYGLILDETYSSKQNTTDEDEALAIATEIVSQYIDPKEYSVKAQTSVLPKDANGGKIFGFTFIKKIGEYDTCDKITVSVTSKGDLLALYLDDVGLFSGREIPKIDDALVTASLEEKLGEIYAKYSYTYQIVGQSLTVLQNERVSVVSEIEVRLDDKFNTAVILATEIE